jgi:hypothetical protein
MCDKVFCYAYIVYFSFQKNFHNVPFLLHPSVLSP